MHSRFVRAVCSIISVNLSSFVYIRSLRIVTFNISSENRRNSQLTTMKNQQSLRFNNSQTYFTTCLRNYTSRIRGIRPFKHPSPRIEFIKRASLFALILAASSFDNRVDTREAAIQRRERRRFPTVFPTRVYMYMCTHTRLKEAKRSRSLCIGSPTTFHAKLLAPETNSFPAEKTLNTVFGR